MPTTSRESRRSLFASTAPFAFVAALALSLTTCGGEPAADHEDEEIITESNQSALTSTECSNVTKSGSGYICHRTSTGYAWTKVTRQQCCTQHEKDKFDYIPATGATTCNRCMNVNWPCGGTVTCCSGLTCTSGKCVAAPACLPDFAQCSLTGGPTCCSNSCNRPVGSTIATCGPQR